MKYILLHNANDNLDLFDGVLGIFDTLDLIYKFLYDKHKLDISNITIDDWDSCNFMEEVKNYKMFNMFNYYTIYGFDDFNKSIYSKFVESFFLLNTNNNEVYFRIYLRDCDDYNPLSAIIIPDYNIKI